MRAERIPRVVLAWALALSVAGLFCLQGVTTFQAAGQRLGFAPVESPAGLAVHSVAPGQPAERAGLLAGDRIVAVDGRPVLDLADYDAASRSFRRGRPVALRIVRGGTAREIPVVPGVPFAPAVLLLRALTAAGFLAVAILALHEGKGDVRGWLLTVFAATAALEISLPIRNSPTALRTAAFAAFYLLTGLQAGVQLHLASLIPERPGWLRRRPWVLPLYYALGLGMGMAGCAAYLTERVLGLRLFPWGLGDAHRLLMDVALPAWSVAVTLVLTVQTLSHPEPRGRHQSGLVLAAAIPWMLCVLAFTFLERSGIRLPAWTGALETLVLLGYPVAFFAAIFRYDLFDIERVVRRGLIYTTLTGALALVFYAALGAGGALFTWMAGGQASIWSLSASTLLLGLVFAPLRRSLHRLIDRRFFPERYALRQRLIALAGELPALGQLPLMGRCLVERLAGIFLVRSAALLLADPAAGRLSVVAATGDSSAPLDMALNDPAVERLRRAGRPLPSGQLDPEGLAVPLLCQERLIGVLVIGRKEGSRAWPAEEVDLLNLLAHHAATVFENARLFASATYEGLTGLLRREAILEQLDRELERALRHGRPLAVAVADLDHFKSVNDRYGHLAGDALLRRVAGVLGEALRSADRAGRYGGEEFLLVLPETGLAGAAAVAEKVRRLVEGLRVPVEGGPAGGLAATVSIGIAALEGREGWTGRDLIAAADRSLYEAKSAGRNRVHPRVA